MLGERGVALDVVGVGVDVRLRALDVVRVRDNSEVVRVRRVVDYDGAGLKSAEVRVRKGSLLLARCSVGSFGEDTAANYSVAVPMSNADIPAAASNPFVKSLRVI